MNIVEFWKAFVAEKTHYSQYDREDFLQALTANVPDWKEQVRNRDIWPDLHCQGRNINETIYVDVIIEEAGLEFAYYLVEKWEHHLDASMALDYCTKHIATDWAHFPSAVQDKILSFNLREFLAECRRQPNLWTGLSKEQKASLLKEAEEQERLYIADLLLFNLWSKELDFKDTPYVRFATDEFKHLKYELGHVDELRRRNERLARWEHRFSKWEMPSINNGIFDHLRYSPSRKMCKLKEVTSIADEESAKQIDAIMHSLERFVEFDW